MKSPYRFSPRLTLSSGFFLLTLLSSGSAFAQLNINTDQTLTVDQTGANGTAPATPGTGAVSLGADNLTVVIDANIKGGDGGNGANGGANNASSGAYGFTTSGRTNSTVTVNAGRTIIGGHGGNGGNGAGSAGGNGASAGAGVNITGNIANFTTYGTITGGNAGNGGNGNGGNNAGGNGITGGNGISISGTNTVLVVGGNLTGGNAGNGGTSSGTANNSVGGTGGHAIRNTAANTSITVLPGVQLIGGTGGSAGTGGSGNAGSSGAGGRGISVGAAIDTITIGNNALLRGGNSGSNTSGGAGLDVDDVVTTITNSGMIEAGNGTVTGIAVDIDASVTNFTNTSTGILGTASSGGDAFDVGSGSTVGTFINNGLIQSSSGHAIDVGTGTTITNFQNAGTLSSQTGRGLSLTGTITNFQNSGTISAADGFGINILGGGAIDDTIDNTGGTISSANTSATQGTITYSINMNGKSLIGGTLRNTAPNGNVLYSASSQTGAFTLQDVAIQGNISGGNNAQNITLAGDTSFQGHVDLGGGANIFTLNNRFTDSVGTDFKATGGTLALTVGSQGNATLNKAQILANNITTLDIVSGGLLRLNQDFAGSGALTNNGSVTIAAGKVLSMASMTAGGANNVWNFGVNGNGDIGRLDIGGGNAVDFTNSSIGIDASVLGTGLLTNGAELLIADGGSAATLGALSNTLAQESSQTLNFRILRGDNAAIAAAGTDNTRVYVEVERTALQAIAQSASTQSVASVVDAIGATSDPGLTSIQVQLQQASSQQQVDNILKELLPTTEEAVITASTNTVSDVAAIVSERMTGLRGAGASSDELRNNLWVKGFARVASQDGTPTKQAYDAGTAGLSAGFDHRTENDELTFGAALSYGSTDIDASNGSRIDDHTQIDGYIATLYGDMAISHGFYIEGIASYGYFKNDASRQALGNRITYDYDARVWNSRIELGNEMVLNNTGVTLVPNMSADYNHYSADSYQERGPGALSVVSDDVKSLRFGAGLDAVYDYYTQDGKRIQPKVSVGYSYDVIGDKSKSTSGFVAAPGAGRFETQGPNPEQSAFTLGAGVNIYTAGQWHMQVDYDFEGREDYASHGGFVRAGYRF